MREREREREREGERSRDEKRDIQRKRKITYIYNKKVRINGEECNAQK